MKLLSVLVVGVGLWAANGFAQQTPPVKPAPAPGPGRQEFRDLEYVAGGAHARSLDLYIPEKTAGLIPVVVWIHGGAWTGGDKTDGGSGVFLAQRGYAVACINYRMGRGVAFPDQLHDCKAAVRWLRAHAAQYHLDPDHIGAWGVSAGAHLAALVGVTGGDPALEGAEGNGTFSSRVQAVCDWYGPVELVTPLENDPKILGPCIVNLLGGPKTATKERAIQASPITYITTNAPPFLIMHGAKDHTVPVAQAETFAEAFKKVGANYKLVVVPTAGHGLGGRENADRVVEFFNKYLKSAGKSPK